MNSKILFETKSKNKYIYDVNDKDLQVIDDEIYYLLQNHDKDSDREIESYLEEQFGKSNRIKLEFVNSLISENTTLKSEPIKTQVSSDVIKYYLSNYPQITFEVTERCNLDCKYCTYGSYYDGHDVRCDKDLKIESAKALLNYVFNYCKSEYSCTDQNIISIGFYGGEPLLRTDFIDEIITHSRNLENDSITFDFAMTTNGTLLKRNVEYLSKNKIKLLVSLDGDEKNHSYRSFKNGQNSFGIVFDNIKYVQEKYPDYFTEFVNFNSVLHNRNSVKEINSFILSNFDKKPMISEIATDGLVKEKQDELLSLFKNKHEDLMQSEDYYKYFKEENPKENPDFTDAMFFMYNMSNLVYSNYIELFLGKTKTVKPSGTCLPFSKKIFVTANGKMLACENIAHKYALGEIKNEEVFLDFEEVVKKYNLQLNKISKLCERCFKNSNCAQCMYHMNIEDDKVICYGFTNKSDAAKYLKEIVSFLEENPAIFKKILTETALS